ncbi:hypothetical protein, partial [Chromobacterium violaceum]
GHATILPSCGGGGFVQQRLVDVIVLSSEREHEDALIKIIRPRLKKNQDVQIVSWKELAAFHDRAELCI